MVNAVTEKTDPRCAPESNRAIGLFRLILPYQHRAKHFEKSLKARVMILLCHPPRGHRPEDLAVRVLPGRFSGVKRLRTR